MNLTKKWFLNRFARHKKIKSAINRLNLKKEIPAMSRKITLNSIDMSKGEYWIIDYPEFLRLDYSPEDGQIKAELIYK